MSKLETRCIHGNLESPLQDEKRAISFPIYQTSSFGHIETGHNASGFDYTRESNPTRRKLEETVSALEGAAGTTAFSSGMAAIAAVFELFSPGDHVLCSRDLYGGVVRLHNLINAKNGLMIDYVDTTDIQAVKKGIRPETKAIYVETPGNPMMEITDLKACAEIAAEQGLLLIVDNTFLSPYFQNPLALGADIVVHSGSKFLAGHNDTIAGMVCAREKEVAEKIQMIGKTTGGVLSPFDSWLVLRGIKTLSVRMRQQQENAKIIVDWLLQHPKVERVYYPGLLEQAGQAVNEQRKANERQAVNEQRKVNERQARGTGSMISFRVDSKETALQLLGAVKVVTFAESLGGTESLITYPKVQTHADVPEDVRASLGITDTLIRMSVGLEDADDIIEDLRQALEKEKDGDI